MAVDEVVVRASLKDELSKGLRNIQGEVRQLERQVNRATGTQTQRNVGGLSRSFTGLGAQVKSVDGSLRMASASLGHLAAQATRTASIGLGALGVAAAGFGLKASASFERSRIAFGTLVESVEGGNDLFAQLQAYNLKTPFELGEISSATQTLLQFGFTGQNVMETLKAISDISATTAAPGENLNRIALALGQISSAGVLRGQDLNQLVQAGFPAYQLLTQVTGMTTQELRKQMETGLTLPAEEFIAALNEGGGVLAKFASGAQMQSQTLSGVFSNLKDTTQVQLAEAFQPLADGLTKTLPEFSATLGGFIDKVAPPLSRIGLILVDSVGKMLPIIEPPLTALLDGLGTLLEAMAPGFLALEPVMGDLGVAIGEMVTALVPVMPELVEALVAVVGVLPDMVRLLTAFVPLVEPMASIVTELASMDGVAGALLVTLLGYRVLSTVITPIIMLTGALSNLALAQAAAGGAPGAAGVLGKVGKAARVGGGVLAGGALIAGGVAAGPSLMGDASMIGGAAVTGASIGSVVPGVGTLVGAGVGAAIGGGVAVGRRWSAADSKPMPQLHPAVNVGAINVNNPRSDIDVQRAVAAGIAEERRAQSRRE